MTDILLVLLVVQAGILTYLASLIHDDLHELAWGDDDNKAAPEILHHPMLDDIDETA